MSDIEVVTHDGKGYSPVFDFESWRVAYLNSEHDYFPENIDFAQYHSLTDEVFVLIIGDCTLFSFGSNQEELGDLSAIRLLPGKAYNVRKGVWHTHALMPNTKVLIVENSNTTCNNSPSIFLNENQRKEILQAFEHLHK